MKKQNLIQAVALIAVASMEQVFRPGFQPLAEQQQQAKTATVAVNALAPANAPDAIVEGIAQADPLRTTLGGVIVLAMKAKDEALYACGTLPQALNAREVFVGLSQANLLDDIVTAIDVSANTTKSADLTFDGGAENNAPMTNGVANGNGLSTVVNAALAAAKPSFSIQSAINKLEDLIAADGTVSGIVLVDQTDKRVVLFTMPHANFAAALAIADDVGGNDMIGKFTVDASPTASAEGQFGE